MVACSVYEDREGNEKEENMRKCISKNREGQTETHRERQSSIYYWQRERDREADSER